MTAAERIRTCRVEFDGSVALINEGKRSFSGHISVSPERRQRVMRERVEVGVGADAVVHAPAKESIDRAVAIFAEDIPAGDFETRERADDGRVGALSKAAGVGASEH